MSEEFCYLIIGNGKLANHLCYYFAHLKIRFFHWYRNKNNDNVTQLHSLLKKVSHVIVAITDSQVDDFIESHIPDGYYNQKTFIHCSGSLLSKYAFTAHPLQTFAPTLYSFDDYLKIPFIIEYEGPSFSELLPGLGNVHYKIQRQDKHYYHALCVMANNFTTLLWQKFFLETNSRFKMQKKDVLPFLEQTFTNIANNDFEAFTGPLARKDVDTIKNDLNSLQGDNFHYVFESFVKAFNIKV